MSRRLLAWSWLLAGLLLVPASAEAGVQIPPPDSIPPPDTIPLPDTIPEEEPVVVRNLPEFTRPVPPGWETAVWEWDREGLQSTRALTLAELLEEVPGVIAIRGGDHGTPVTMMAAGLGPGRVRVFLDGAELVPLDGGMPDLSRIGLVGLDRVRVLRRPGEVRVELLGLQVADPRPMSLLEVGTGDLQTNLFRGTFVHPTALGGNVLVGLDRIDTDGPRRDEVGSAFGAHLRHTLIRSDRGGVAWEFRRMTSRRPPELYTPEDVNRTDWIVRARYRVPGDAVVGLFYHHSSLGVNEERDGEGADTLITATSRAQIGLRMGVDRGVWWAEGEIRDQRGAGWPGSVLGLRAGGLVPGLGGVAGEVERQGWGGRSEVAIHGRIWSRPVLGVSLYGEAESGSRAAPHFIPAPRPPEEDEGGEESDPEVPGPRFTSVDGFRVGAEYRRDDLYLGVAALAVDADSLHPTGLPFDRDGVSTAGGRRTGFEVGGRLPLTRLMQGLSLEAETRFWGATPEWRYTPERTWGARVRYHNVFLETRNLEVWGNLGVQGRDPMTVPLSEGDESLARVPFNQSWYGWVQVRVVSVRVFIRWDNFTFREDNQDLPGRNLPVSRAMYGVRWTLWN